MQYRETKEEGVIQRQAEGVRERSINRSYIFYIGPLFLGGGGGGGHL